MMAKVSAAKTSLLVPRWKRHPVHPSWVLQTHAAPTLPPSCREPSVQIVSKRLHSLAILSAGSRSSMMMPGKLHPCPSEVPSLLMAATLLRRAVSVESRPEISSGPCLPRGLATRSCAKRARWWSRRALAGVKPLSAMMMPRGVDRGWFAGMGFRKRV